MKATAKRFLLFSLLILQATCGFSQCLNEIPNENSKISEFTCVLKIVRKLQSSTALGVIPEQLQNLKNLRTLNVVLEDSTVNVELKDNFDKLTQINTL